MRTPSANAGNLVLRYLRFAIAGQAADARDMFGGLGTMLTDLAQIAELSVARNMELSMARLPVMKRLGRGGHVDAIRDELTELDRERLAQCAQGQQSELFGRAQGQPFGFRRHRAPYQSG